MLEFVVKVPSTNDKAKSKLVDGFLVNLKLINNDPVELKISPLQK